MKIICFVFDPNVCGPHVRARAVYRRMVDEGHEVTIAIPAGPGSAADFYRQTGIAVDRLAIRKPVSPRKTRAFALYLLALPFGVAKMMSYLRRARPDVVHVNGAYDLVPGLAAWLSRLPIVWHLIDTAPPRFLARILGGIVSALATRVVCVASAVAGHYGISAHRSEKIFEPVDTDRFSARDPGDRPHNPAVIGLLANWNPLKGQDRFIEVIRRLRDHGIPMSGRIMGALSERQSDYWRPLLARIDEMGLGDVIEAPGFVDDTATALAGIDVLLLTSRSEACPISVLEAMAVGVPQVCFRVGGVDEMLGTAAIADDRAAESGPGAAGISVPEGDIDAMVAAVKKLLTDHDFYHRCAVAGQERARQKFRLASCVDRHRAVYESAIAKRERAALDA